jgi:glycogen debranching enzyme
MYDVSQKVELNRLPELFCGFDRRHGEGPTAYPVACAPQTWAAGAVFLLVQACLGLNVDGVLSRVSFNRPVLPPEIDELVIRNLRVGGNDGGAVDVLVRRLESDVSVNILRRTGDVKVVVVK